MLPGVPISTPDLGGYGERQSVRAFGLAMGRPVGWRFSVWALTGQSVRVFGAGMKGPVVDALSLGVVVFC